MDLSFSLLIFSVGFILDSSIMSNDLQDYIDQFSMAFAICTSLDTYVAVYLFQGWDIKDDVRYDWMDPWITPGLVRVTSGSMEIGVVN